MSSKPKFQFHAIVNKTVHVADLFTEIKKHDKELSQAS